MKSYGINGMDARNIRIFSLDIKNLLVMRPYFDIINVDIWGFPIFSKSHFKSLKNFSLSKVFFEHKGKIE